MYRRACHYVVKRFSPKEHRLNIVSSRSERIIASASGASRFLPRAGVCAPIGRQAANTAEIRWIKKRFELACGMLVAAVIVVHRCPMNPPGTERKRRERTMDPRTLLIVHPDGSRRALMASVLSTMGHQVETAPNAREAIRIFEGSPVDLVLAGADATDSASLSSLFELKREHARIPMILLSSKDHPAPAGCALRHGVSSVLPLPASTTEIRAAVAQVLGIPEDPPAPRARGPEPVTRAIETHPPAPRSAFDPMRQFPAARPIELGSEPMRRRAMPLRRKKFSACRRAKPLRHIVEHGDGATLFRKSRPEGARRPVAAVVGPAVPRRTVVASLPTPAAPAAIVPLKQALEGPERDLIRDALAALGGNRQETARALDIDRTTLYKKMKKYKLF
jgi:DNA-binding response OmpR family regulator